MIDNHIKESIVTLMAACGLGEVTAAIKPVSGGFLHRMYRVEIPEGVFAVKYLNPEIMARPTAAGNFARAEEIERIFEEHGLPIVPALIFGGKKMQQVDEKFFYVFHWQSGHITDWHTISTEQCWKVGNILGQMHAIAPEEMSEEEIASQEPEIRQTDWHGYTLRALEQGSEIASLLEGSESLLAYADQELNAARASLPNITCLSNEDMDPKNVMWEGDAPWVIDLECLERGNPMSHVVQLALQWAGTATCELKPENLRVFLEGYLAAYDNGFRAYDTLYGIAYTWVEWLEYNIRRALGECQDEAEQEMGISEVKNTLERIAYLRQVEEICKRELARN